MAQNRTNDAETTQPLSGTNRTQSFESSGGGEGRGTNLDEVAWLIANLKETITQQSSIIENVRADLTEIKTKQQNLESQNAELQEEIRSLRTQLSTYSESLPSTRTWASVAASGISSGSGVSLPRITGTGNPEKESKCLRISTPPKPNTTDGADTSFTRYLPSDAANTYIRNALLNADTTKDVQVVGVGTTKTGYVIRFRDQQSAETARANTEWLEELGNGTKLVKLRLGVVVHRTPTEDISLPEEKTQSIKKIMEENDLETKGFQIED